MPISFPQEHANFHKFQYTGKNLLMSLTVVILNLNSFKQNDRYCVQRYDSVDLKRPGFIEP